MATIVIFGATGDLTHRKLVPAMFKQYCKGALPQQLQIVGFSNEDYAADSLRERLRDGVQQFTPETYDADKWQTFAANIQYVQGDLTRVDDFAMREAALQTFENYIPTNRLYYLAISPTLYPLTITNLGQAGMANESNGKRNIIIEKPFGRDLASAQALNKIVHSAFEEQQVYRIDHYLGKETAQNVLFFRFANAVFESVWDRSHIDNVQITVMETVDVGHRAGYYDKAGVMRDMIQNHLMQLLTLVAMEPPASFNADELRNEKVKVLKSIRPIKLEDTIQAQYDGYCGTQGVAPDSRTPTYAALKLYIDNWRWQGVPFYLRSGKALAHKATEIVIQFKTPPRMMFDMPVGYACPPNVLSLCIQPDEGIHFRFETKIPGSPQMTRSSELEFHYRDALPAAYERLLVDALEGDASLFIRSDEIEQAWRIVGPIIEGWQNQPLLTYPYGSGGPDAAENLIRQDGFYWQMGCMH